MKSYLLHKLKDQLILILMIGVGLCFPISGFAQNFDVLPVAGLCTSQDDIAGGFYEDQIFVMVNGKQDLVNDYQWNKHNVFHIETATRGNTLNEWTKSSPLFPFLAKADEGPATYNSTDSVIYFSSANAYGKAKGATLKIYSIRKTSIGWTTPVLLPFCNGNFDYAHPWYDEESKVMVFSSNKPGGQGLMDIWYCHKTDSSWTEPVNCGVMVNGPSNEIFPSICNGDIYYGSNSGGGPGGYDIKMALKSQQWKSSIVLESPINSTFDEINYIQLSDQKALITSNRSGGAGGDDIYVVIRKPKEEEKHHYTAMLRVNDQPGANVRVSISNVAKEIVLDENTNEQGALNIETLRLNEKYRMQLFGMDPTKFTASVLQIMDIKGNVVKELRFNAMGVCELELLPLNYEDLQLLSLDDESLLTIQLEGQLFEDKPGDVGRGEIITILDDKGDPVAIAFTNDNGKFKFTDLKPQLDYKFKLDEATKAENILITDRGEKIVLPVLSAEAHYQRIQESDAIKLINENNEVIYIKPKDVFVINRIYYDYNSSNLTAEAKVQLDQLVMVMKSNPEIKLELRSHTDARGNAEYNLKLSEKRAKSAVVYISSQQVEVQRLTPVGFGETLLLNECADGIECSDAEHAINRRTEIKFSK